MGATRVKVATAVLAVATMAGACSNQSDFTAAEPIEAPTDVAAPTTSIARRTLTTTTTVAPPTTDATAPAGGGAAGAALAGDPTATLAAVARGVSVDPAVLGLLNGAELPDIADLLSIDPVALGGLGLDPAQLSAFAGAVAASPPPVQAQLGSGAPDPAVLLGLLAGSVDLESIAAGSAGILAQALADAVGAVALEVSPELTISLTEVLEEIDPDSFAQFNANQDNAALLALFTSAILDSNPLLTQQLLANPALDPVLREILVQLEDLSKVLGDAARVALIDAVSRLFPGLVPPR